MMPFGKQDLEELRPLVESVRSVVDLQPVLQVIVERVRNSGIWPMCAIGVADPDDKEILVPAQAGFQENYPKDIRFPASGSATLEAIRRKQPIAICDVQADTEFPVLQEAARAAGYRSILLIPLAIEDIRAVVTFGSAEPHDYTQDEIQLANAISQQVMIAIENAHHYEREKQRVEQLQSLNLLIADQNRLLQRMADAHTALTRLVLDDAGLEGILQAIRNLLGNPVAIENENFQLLVHSEDWEHYDRHRWSSIKAGGTAPEIFSDPEIAARLSELRHNRRAILTPISPSVGIEKRRIVAPVIAGGTILGYMWVMEALRPFDHQDLVTTEQAALVVALEMVKQRAAFEAELRLKADFLDDLLSHRPVKESEMLQRASYLGYSFMRPSSILVVELSLAGSRAGELNDRLHRDQKIIQTIQKTSKQLIGENLVAFQSSQVVVIVPVNPTQEKAEETLRALAKSIRQEIQKYNHDLRVLIGVGDVCAAIGEIYSAYQQARRAIEAARSLGHLDETFHLNDLGVYGLLFQKGAQGELEAFARRMLHPLVDYDQRNGADLVKTIDIFLICQGKMSESAQKLYIHVNTLRQRLERIEQVLQVRLDDPGVRLNLQLALQVDKIISKSGGG